MTDISRLLRDAGITVSRLEEERSSGSVFLSYLVHGQWVSVEITAPNFAAVLVRLTTRDQIKLVAVLLNLVPEVGDRKVIVDETGDGRKRGAYVIRIKSESDEDINLLITR